MAGEEEDGEEKPFEPSQKRLDDARRKGEVPHSADVTNAAAYGGMLLAAFALGGDLLLDLGTALSGFLARPDDIATFPLAGPFVPAAALTAIASPLWPWFVIPAIAALISIIAQRALVFAPEKLKPRLDRISPIAGAKNKFGRKGLFEFAKSTIKLILISAILTVYLLWRLPEMLAALALEPGQVTRLMLRLAAEFLAIVFAITLVLGSIDALFQVAEHRRKHRMSKKELADEQKESEGDPWLKGRRREKGREIATNRMMSEVPTADVVIVNPTHYAIALKWERTEGGAPVCVAKGQDEVARRIREVAAEAGVPIRHDPPTARALYRVVELGEEIRPEHYRAVAVAIRFAEAMRARARGQGIRERDGSGT